VLVCERCGLIFGYSEGDIRRYVFEACKVSDSSILKSVMEIVICPKCEYKNEIGECENEKSV
jgi:uncharacterized protein YbaR (Trm112 family)